MAKKRIILVVASITVICAVVAGFLTYTWQTEDNVRPHKEQQTGVALNLGITYLPLNPRMSALYELEGEWGALVTKVSPESIADRAGMQVGDIIISFNGVKLGEDVPLWGLMASCLPAENSVVKIWRINSHEVVQLDLIPN